MGVSKTEAPGVSFSLLSSVSIMSSKLLFECFHHLMVPVTFVPGKQITVVVSFWTCLSFQIPEWQFSDWFKHIINFSWLYCFLVEKTELMTYLFTWQSFHWYFENWKMQVSINFIERIYLGIKRTKNAEKKIYICACISFFKKNSVILCSQGC